jgi:hypothetical protein
LVNHGRGSDSPSKEGKFSLGRLKPPLLVSVQVVEVAIISISTTTSTVRAIVKVIIPTAVEVIVRATVEVIVRAPIEVVVALATAVPTAIARATAVPAAECTTMLHGARCTFARAPSVRAALASIDIDAVLRLAIDAINVGARWLPFLGLLLQTR